MTFYELLQNAIICIVVLMSALYVLRKLMPNWVGSKQLALATEMKQPARSLLVRKFGSFMMPDASSGGGCGSGCSSCSTCASNPDTESASKLDSNPHDNVESKPLNFMRHL
jgi:hypothetical protein